MFGKTVAIEDNMPTGSSMVMQAVLVFNNAVIGAIEALCHGVAFTQRNSKALLHSI
jgi:hypothetical protein